MCKECDEEYCSKRRLIQRGNHNCGNCGDGVPVFECTTFNKDDEIDPDGNFDKNGKEISVYENNNCCHKHFLPAGELCEDYTPDTGPGILIKNCSNCYYFNDRRLKYKPLQKW